MTEGQAFMEFPTFLAKTAATQYRARQHGGHVGEITAWPEAVQYLLRNYETPGVIRRAASYLRTIRQLPDEDESAYAARINEAAYRCGNIHLEDEKMTFFVDGLQPELRTTVARYREDQPRHEMTLERLVHHAQDEGDALRARIIAEGERVSKRRQAAFATPTRSTQKTQRQVAILEPTQVGEPDAPSENAEELYAFPGEIVDGSFSNNDLPSTITDLDPAKDQEQILMLTRQLRDNRNNRVRRNPPPVAQPKHIPFGAPRTTNRVGWCRDTSMFIFHRFYERHHVLSQCTANITDLPRIVSHFESLTTDEKARVPDKYFLMARSATA